jgi:uncharacterized membrane protein YfcA
MPLELLLLIAAAFAAGFVDAVVGGGGLIQLPSFVLAYPQMPFAQLLGTNKLASFAGTSVATIRYMLTTAVPWRMIAPALFGALVMAWLGAHLASHLDKALMRPVVLVLLVAVAVYTFFKKDLGQHRRETPQGTKAFLLSLLTGALLGLYDGFFGPGTGSFLILIFVTLFGYEFLTASVCAKLVNCATNVAALAYFGVHDNIHYAIAIPVAASNMAGSWLGARTALRKGNKFVRVFFLVVVCALILRLGYDVFVNR